MPYVCPKCGNRELTLHPSEIKTKAHFAAGTTLVLRFDSKDWDRTPVTCSKCGSRGDIEMLAKAESEE